MAIVEPFAALRPAPSFANQISAPPYDVLSTEEARQIVGENRFLNISKPEIDFAAGTDPYSPEIYAKGAENFKTLQDSGLLLQDPASSYYIYRQIMGEHAQTGLVAVVDCNEYESGVIKKHELTRPSKEDDRVRHMEALNAQTGLVFLTYRSLPSINGFIDKRVSAKPDFDFKASDGVQHTAWTISDTAGIDFLSSQFEDVDCLYIADGHHRSAAALRLCKARNGSGRSSRFIAVLFPDQQMQILAYNRIIKDLNGLSSDGFLGELKQVFEVKENFELSVKNELSLFLNGEWLGLRFRPEYISGDTPGESLDAALLQRHVLSPILGIEDSRTSDRIDFVGDIRGSVELEKRVESGWACAFKLFPTTIEDLQLVADSGGLMPPKSTWFEPKLRDGLFCHML